MGTCQNEECTNETKQSYKYCTDCYTKWSQENQQEKDLVDILTKMNWNLGSISKSLHSLAHMKSDEIMQKEGDQE